MIISEKAQEQALFEKLKSVPIKLLIITLLIYGVGVIALFSASKGNFYPWAFKHLVNGIIALPLIFVIILTDIKVWFKTAYILYGFGLVLLLIVKIFGVEGGLGAQRWIAIGDFRFQPSELVKVFIVLSLARFYHLLHFNNLHKFSSLVFPLMLIGASAGLVLLQPNLGTAAIISMVGVIVMFITGLSWKKIFSVVAVVLLALPILWANMHDYQKKRVETFLNPEQDPLGAGYNIIQSKIAIGAGGLIGKGLSKGTQSQLNFVPEQQTDFIFSIIAEEFGYIGTLILLLLYALFFHQARKVAEACQSNFGKTIAIGMAVILFVHVFVNIGMVSGILPVVGVPLPFLSYGGSSLISSMIAVAFIMNAYIHRKTKISVSDDSF
ncbi:MAG: rod shape-determining protein RodA [Rickettsiales bacterium]|nr:rod shape-determining protein RodA [Rickettsiales bacterium]